MLTNRTLHPELLSVINLTIYFKWKIQGVQFCPISVGAIWFGMMVGFVWSTDPMKLWILNVNKTHYARWWNFHNWPKLNIDLTPLD